MHLMVEALNLHVIAVSWDLQYLTCLAESSRARIKTIEVTNMVSGTTVTKPGKLFYDTLTVNILFHGLITVMYSIVSYPFLVYCSPK